MSNKSIESLAVEIKKELQTFPAGERVVEVDNLSEEQLTVLNTHHFMGDKKYLLKSVAHVSVKQGEGTYYTAHVQRVGGKA